MSTTAQAPEVPQSWKRGPLSPLGVVGVLTPPANTTVEPELVSLLPHGLSLHASRLPGKVEEDTGVGLRERFLGYNATLAQSADSFGGLPLDALVFACTGSSYLVGPGGEAALLADLRAGGAHTVNTAAGTVRQVLESAGAERIALVSPYPDWLTELAVAYWEACGLAVSGVANARESGSIYAVTPTEVAGAVSQLNLDGVDALILSGTGMATAGAIAELSGGLSIPAISSATCSAWWLTSTVAPESISSASPIIAALDKLVRR
jgi:maleate isomerase